MTADLRKTLQIEATPAGEVRVSAPLFPEEIRHGAVVRGFTAAGARDLAAQLLAAAAAVEQQPVSNGASGTFIAPETGWYRRVGDTFERIDDIDGEQQARAGARDVVRFEVGEIETRAYQNSGAIMQISDAQVIPSDTWTTMPWDHR